MTFQQLWNAVQNHNEDLGNPFVNPSDEIVKEINDYWSREQKNTADENAPPRGGLWKAA